MYNAASADREYKDILSEARTGISYSEEEIAHLDQLISPLIRKGQSINHICVNNKDSIMVSERTIYRLIDYSLFSARNIDLVRKVKYSSCLLLQVRLHNPMDIHTRNKHNNFQ